MTTLAPINVDIKSLPTPTPPSSSTVIGVVGSATAPSGVTAPTAENEIPVAVNSLSDALAAFRNGTIYDACEIAFSLANVYVVGVKFDSENAVTADRNASLVNAIDAFRRAASVTGKKPTILIAPGETYLPPTGGTGTPPTPLVYAGSAVTNGSPAKIETVAASLKAIGILDASPSTNVIAQAWSIANGKKRCLAIPQMITTPDKTNLPGSSFLAAALARNDALYGVNDSFSNRDLIGITLVSPTRSFEYTDQTTDALVLRTSKLSSVIRDFNGIWRVIGGILGGVTGNDPFRYIGVQRMVDIIESEIINLAVNRWNRNQRANFITRLVSDVQEYLDLLVGGGALIFALCAPDPIQNTATARSAGLVYLYVTLRFPAINEQINFTVEASLV